MYTYLPMHLRSNAGLSKSESLIFFLKSYFDLILADPPSPLMVKDNIFTLFYFLDHSQNQIGAKILCFEK